MTRDKTIYRMHIIIRENMKSENRITEQLLEEKDFLKVKTNEMEKSKAESKQVVEKFKKFFEYCLLGKSIVGIDWSLQINKSFSGIFCYTIEGLETKKLQEINHLDNIKLSTGFLQSLFNGKTKKTELKNRYMRKNRDVIGQM